MLANLEGANLNYAEGDPALDLSNSITVSDADDALLASATVSIVSNYDNSEDVLALASPVPGITASWNSGAGVLTLSGNSSVANYQTALRLVSYQNTDVNDATAATRTIRFQVNDGTAGSNLLERDVVVTASLLGPANMPYTESFESDGEGTLYQSNEEETNLGNCDFFDRFSSQPTCHANPVTGWNGSFYWAAEDVSNMASGIGQLTLRPLNFSSGNSLSVNILLGESPSGSSGWETDDYIRVLYSMDGGPYQIMGAFYGTGGLPGVLREDVDLDGLADGVGTTLTTAMQDVNFVATGLTGSTISLRVEVKSNGSEELVFDHIRAESQSLPVVLLDFQARVEREDVLLNWITASELENQGFIIEMATVSPQGTIELFQPISVIPSQGNSQSLQSYQHRIENLRAGNYLFRLKQLDLNGAFSLSKMVEVSVGRYGLQLYPNPASEQVSIEVDIPEPQIVRLTIFSTLGQTVLQETWLVSQSGIQTFTIQPTQLSHGTYYYQLHTLDKVYQGQWRWQP